MFEPINLLNGVPKCIQHGILIFHMVFNTSIQTIVEKSDHSTRKSLPHPLYKKYVNPYAHIEVSKCVIISNEETNDYHIVNLFPSIFKNIVFEWAENFVKDHPCCTFANIQQIFYKHY